jgi:TrmH family RNA methyltransferase
LPRIRVVLVRPETAANVGATARVVRNTGLGSIALVSPGDWRTVECWRTAWGAHEVLEQAQVYAELSAALAGCAYVGGFTGRQDRGVASLDVRDMAGELASLAPDEEAALVFGPEGPGLTLAELALCGRRVRIPAHTDQPSLNLSHAVMVAGYEVFRAGRRPDPATRRATHAEKERLLAMLAAGLRALRALPADDTDGYFREWRALAQRTDLTVRELHMLEHVARKMLERGDG